MTHNIHYAQQARRDLDDIWDYIAEELQNADAAGRMVNRILDAVDRQLERCRPICVQTKAAPARTSSPESR